MYVLTNWCPFCQITVRGRENLKLQFHCPSKIFFKNKTHGPEMLLQCSLPTLSPCLRSPRVSTMTSHWRDSFSSLPARLNCLARNLAMAFDCPIYFPSISRTGSIPNGMAETGHQKAEEVWIEVKVEKGEVRTFNSYMQLKFGYNGLKCLPKQGGE